MSNVIVLGRNCSSALGVIRSFGKVGYEVDLIYNAFRRDGFIVSTSKYINQYQEILAWNDEAIINAILSHCDNKEKPILFSTDDHTAELIARNAALLKKNFIFPEFLNGDTEKQMAYYMRKDVQVKLAEKCGLPIAKSWVISLSDEQPRIPDGIPYPCFSKPLLSADGGKGEIGVCSSRDALEKKIAALKAKGRRELMVQELLAIDGEYVMEGVCRDQEVVLPAIIQKTCVAQKNKGVTLSGYLAKFSVLPENVRQGILRFLKEMHYVGMFDLELIVANGKIYFGEINFRSGGPSYIYTLCGVNLPALAVKAMTGETISGSHQPVLGKTFVNDKVLWEDFGAGYMGYGEFRKKYYHSDFSLVRDEDDPEPSKLYASHMRKQTIKQILRKLLHR